MRAVAELSDGRTARLKIATSAATADWLRAERRAHAALDGPFVPRLVAFDAGTESAAPILAIEDLSQAHWPPPRQSGQVQRLSDAITALAHGTLGQPVRRPRVSELTVLTHGWHEVARNPTPPLSLQIATARWLDVPLPLTLWRSSVPVQRHARTGELVCNGNRQTVSALVFGKGPLLWYTLKTVPQRCRQWPQVLGATEHAHLPVAQLATPAAVTRCLARALRAGPNGRA